MSQNDSDSLDDSSNRLPLWAQVSLSLTFIGLVYYTAILSTTYISAWNKEDSNNYSNAIEGLNIKGIHPTAPTLLAFWERDCRECEDNIRYFSKLPSSVRAYGVYLKEENITFPQLQKEWFTLKPGTSQLLYDDTELLQTSFRVRGGPVVYLILPKEKALYSYFGKIEDNHEKLREIINSAN